MVDSNSMVWFLLIVGLVGTPEVDKRVLNLVRDRINLKKKKLSPGMAVTFSNANYRYLYVTYKPSPKSKNLKIISINGSVSLLSVLPHLLYTLDISGFIPRLGTKKRLWVVFKGPTTPQEDRTMSTYLCS